MALAASLIAVTSANAATPVSWGSGVYAGNGGTADMAFAQWRGKPITTALDYIGSDNWSEIENPAWSIWAWRQAPMIKLDLSVPLWPWTGGDLATAASGAYDLHFTRLAQNLVAGGLGSITLRLGWEFNGTWFPWSVSNSADAANYAQAWRQIVTAMRAVRGAHFGFDWTFTESHGGPDPSLAYPGDAYVTDIGMDVYDWNESPGQNAAARWNGLVNDGYGLAWQAAFASAHGKPIAFPEWGLQACSYAPTWAGGDDPAFVQNMFNWFATHRTAFEDYSDVDMSSSGLFSGLTTNNGLFPQAAAQYQQLYSAG